MRAESGTTSAVAALSVVVAMLGHALAGGVAVPLGVLPPLVALTAVCWLLGEYLAGERLLTALVLAGVQLLVHVTLDAAHLQSQAAAGMTHHTSHAAHGMATPMSFTASLTMTATHLLGLLAGVLLISRAHHWVHRVLRLLARLVPQVPGAPFPVRRYAAVLLGVPEKPRIVQRWLTANVSRRGPPAVLVFPAPS